MSPSVGDATADGDGPVELVVFSLCAYFGATASAIAGFGGAVMFLGLAAVAGRFMDVSLKHVIMLSMVRSGVTNPLTVYVGGRSSCNVELYKLFAPGVLLGIPIGQFCLYFLPAVVMQRALGIICLVVVVERLLKMRAERAQRGAASKAATSAETASDKAPMIASSEEESALEPAAPLRLRCSRRVVVGSLSALGSGILGSSLGTAGIPVLLFCAYFPPPKAVMRTFICAIAMPSQYLALATFAHAGILSPARDWPSILCVTVSAMAGVSTGNYLHKRISPSLVLILLKICLAGVAIQLLSSDGRTRLVIAMALAAGAACIVGTADTDASALLRTCAQRPGWWPGGRRRGARASGQSRRLDVSSQELGAVPAPPSISQGRTSDEL